MFKFPEEKTSQLYLEQISKNGDEKFGDLKKLILEDKLPKIEGKINVLELGVGGGETMKELKEQIHAKDNVNIIGLDNTLIFSDYFKRNTELSAIVADAGLLPLKDKSLSAINASAILHELSSYGTISEDGEKIFGPNAVKQSLKEIGRCLAKEGILTYRDVSCPKDRLNIKTVAYKRKSWQMFIDLYLPILQNASKKVSPEIFNGYKLAKEDDAINLTLTTQAQREIQRHYITFRDYFRKKNFPEMGIKIINESWSEKENGNKKHFIELSGTAIKHYFGKFNKEAYNDGMQKLSLTMQSDEYDDFTDELIELALSTQASNFQEEWFRREGNEIYTYLNSEEIIKATDETESGLIMQDEYMIPRNYYQRYLDRIIENPEFEGKQIINFIKKYEE